MPGQELVLARPASLTVSTFEVMENAWGLAQQIARTEFVPVALRGKPEAVMAAILTGHEVGLPPMASLSKIHVIEGRPTLSAEAMRALVLSLGHELWFEEINNTRATVVGVRAGSTRETRVTWTTDDAKKAGLEGKKNWRSFPRAMLEARATGELCRLIFADVLGGISYTTEEIDDGVLDVEPAPDDDGPAGEVKPITRKAAPAKKTAAKKAAAPKAAPPAGSATAPPLPPLPGEEEAAVPGPGTSSRVEEPEQAPAEDPAIVTKRAQAIAMRARDVGVDHHVIVRLVTGRTESAKEVNADEGADVLEALRQIKLGEKHLGQDDDGVPVLRDGSAPPEPTFEEQLEASIEDQADGEDVVDGEIVGDEADWDADQWRTFLASRGVKVTETIREAQRLAGQMGEPLPANLDALHGRRSLCSLLRGFAEDLAEQRGMS